MKVKTTEALYAILLFVLFVILPPLAIWYMPTSLYDQIQGFGFNLQSIMIQTVTVGIILATITLIKAIVEPTSKVYLAVALISSGLGLFFVLFILSVGNIADFGVSSLKVITGKAESTVILNLRFFIEISVLIIIIQMIKVYYDWVEAKSGQVQPIKS